MVEKNGEVILKLSHLANLIDLNASVLRLPATERLLADPCLPDHLCYRTPTCACFNTPTICSTQNRFFFISSPSSVGLKTNIHAGTRKTRPIT